MSIEALATCLRASVRHTYSLLRVLGVTFVELADKRRYFRYEQFLLAIACFTQPGGPSLSVPIDLAAGLANCNEERRGFLPVKEWRKLVQNPEHVRRAIDSLVTFQTSRSLVPNAQLAETLRRAYLSFVWTLTQEPPEPDPFLRHDVNEVLDNFITRDSFLDGRNLTVAQGG